MVNVDLLLKKARKSIGKFCIEECKSYCCRKGYLVLSKKEIKLILDNKEKEYEDCVKKLDENKYSLYMGTNNKPCPRLLENFFCSIHTKRNRPLACKEFPIFIKEDIIYLSSRCLAVKQGLFFPYIKKLQKLGYKLAPVENFKALEVFYNK